MSQNVLEVKNLCKYFEVGKGLTLKAVDDVSFEIAPGETLGLVGESGLAKQPADVLVSDYIIKHPEKFFIKEKMSMN